MTSSPNTTAAPSTPQATQPTGAGAAGDRLDEAVAAVASRGYWSVYPESPSPRVYGEGKAEEGKAAYEAHLGKQFELGQPGADGWVGEEVSPYGPALGVTYEHMSPDHLVAAAAKALPRWRGASPRQRAEVCLAVIDRINARAFEVANAVMHTSGQAFVMAFQAGGTHAQDRAVEAVASAYAEQGRFSQTAVWEKPQGKRPPLRMTKTFTPVGAGIALVVGCNTFPTWNAYPGLFASLATGNAVVVKPHPRAVLPLAVTVAAARDVLAEHGFDRDLVLLAPDAPGEGLAAVLAVRPEVKVIDFTGSNAFGSWLEEHARQARVYTEKAGVNSVLVESTGDYQGMLANLAFSLVLYSGQMCTTPQDLLVPAAGIETDAGHKSIEEFAADLGAAINATLGPDEQAVELLGAIVSDAVLGRLDDAAAQAEPSGAVAIPSRAVSHPSYPGARVRTPLVVRASADDPAVAAECFGPVSYLVATDGPAASVVMFRRLVATKGALTASVYSTDEAFLGTVRQAALEVGVLLSENLTSGVYVNQTAAFSDFHGTGANPAANASYTDGDFVAGRFRFVESRRHLPAT
ncbi:MAG TPA: phenylacetic acid degradation protein PaaN [Streptosporangiaceae bacterium]|nr:phenylacetic acid degradation protein PaaN [Streptosporangiaceae bacterium]